MDKTQERLTDAAYIAAMIQGEGTVYLHKAKRRKVFQMVPKVVIYNSDPAVITAVGDRLKRLGVGFYIWKGPGTNRPVYGVSVQGFKRIKTLGETGVLDFLVSDKYGKLTVLLEFIRRRGEAAPNAPYTEDQLNLVNILNDFTLSKSN